MRAWAEKWKTRMESDAEEFFFVLFLFFFRKNIPVKLAHTQKPKFISLFYPFSCHKSFQRQRLSKERQKWLLVLLEPSKTRENKRKALNSIRHGRRVGWQHPGPYREIKIPHPSNNWLTRGFYNQLLRDYWTSHSLHLLVKTFRSNKKATRMECVSFPSHTHTHTKTYPFF